MRIIASPEITGVSEQDFALFVQNVEAYSKQLADATHEYTYALPESSLATPSDEQFLHQALEVTKKHLPYVKMVLLVGIGGSDVGARAVYDALYPTITTQKQGTPRIVSFGTIEPRLLAHVDTLLAPYTDPREVVLVVVSKSGGTTETIANAHVVYEGMKARYGAEHAVNQSIVITDLASPLAHRAHTLGIPCVDMPHKVGGRYSVFTAVGLIPLALAGFDIHAFVQGGASGTALSTNNATSDARMLASSLYHGYKRGLTNHELFMWHPELETLGKWYRQLLAESIGKHDEHGEAVGITPTVAIGSIDLHSHGQLLFGGPHTRVTTHVAIPSLWDNTPCISPNDTNPFILSMLGGKGAGEAIRAMYEGVCHTYTSHGLPYLRIEFDALNEHELGAFMGMHMTSVMLLAHLFKVNAFDQPNVEMYKEETRRLLAQ